MTGPVEEAGQTARSVVDVFKTQPALLGSVLLNIAMMGLLYWGLAGAAASREKILQQVFTNGQQVQELLSKCVVPSKPLGAVEEPHKPIYSEQLPSLTPQAQP